MKKLILLISVLMSLICLASCRTRDYADKYENVKWTCNEPLIEFTVLSESKDYNVGTIKVGDEIIDIVCLWSLTNQLKMYYKDKYDSREYGIYDSDIAIKGSYKIKKGVVTMTVSVDNVFNNKYETMVFTKTDL